MARVQTDGAGITAAAPGVVPQHDLSGPVPGLAAVTAQQRLGAIGWVAHPVAQNDGAVGHLQKAGRMLAGCGDEARPAPAPAPVGRFGQGAASGGFAFFPHYRQQLPRLQADQVGLVEAGGNQAAVTPASTAVAGAVEIAEVPG